MMKEAVYTDVDFRVFDLLYNCFPSITRSINVIVCRAAETQNLILDQIRDRKIFSTGVHGFKHNVRIIFVVEFDKYELEGKDLVTNADEDFSLFCVASFGRRGFERDAGLLGANLQTQEIGGLTKMDLFIMLVDFSFWLTKPLNVFLKVRVGRFRLEDEYGFIVNVASLNKVVNSRRSVCLFYGLQRVA